MNVLASLRLPGGLGVTHFVSPLVRSMSGACGLCFRTGDVATAWLGRNGSEGAKLSAPPRELLSPVVAQMHAYARQVFYAMTRAGFGGASA